MKRFSRCFIASVFSCFFLVASEASAEWEANFTATSSNEEFPKTSGKFYSKLDRFRVDSSYPFELSAYAKAGSRRAEVAVHSFKIRLSSKLEKFSGQLPACLAKEFSACIKEFSLKKTSTEPCATATCDVYEGKSAARGLKKIKVWHLSGEKEPIFVKSVFTKSNGSVVTTVFTAIAKKSRPDSFFSVPPNYKDAGTLEKFFGDLRGESE